MASAGTIKGIAFTPGKYNAAEFAVDKTIFNNDMRWKTSPLSARLGLPLKARQPASSEIEGSENAAMIAMSSKENRTASRLFTDVEFTSPNFGNPHPTLQGMVVIVRCDGKDLQDDHALLILLFIEEISKMQQSSPYAGARRSIKDLVKRIYSHFWSAEFIAHFFDQLQRKGTVDRRVENVFKQAIDKAEVGMKACKRCEKKAAAVRACSWCSKTYYCSMACQAADSESHRLDCIEQRARARWLQEDVFINGDKGWNDYLRDVVQKEL